MWTVTKKLFSGNTILPEPKISERDVLLCLCTCPGELVQSLAESLLSHKLAACVNIINGIHSVYRWEGAIESTNESLMIIKTTRQRYSALEDHIHTEHPYELPEIIAVSLDAGLPAYLEWVAAATKSNQD